MGRSSRLVLGTVQLGMPYGIANRLGQPTIENARAIAVAAWENGVREFDTAQAYGESERVLGGIMRDLGIAGEAAITTKPHPDVRHHERDAIMAAVAQSLDRLGVSQVHCVMLHRETLLDSWHDGIGENLAAIRDAGMCNHVGVSVYSPERALQALSISGIDFVQLPTNVLDHRFERRGVFEAAERENKTVYIRSIFLQGLLLVDPTGVPAKMAAARPVLTELHSLCRRHRLSMPQLALGYIKAQMPNARMVVGVEHVTQLQELVESADVELPALLQSEIRERFGEVGESIVNPSLWPR